MKKRKAHVVKAATAVALSCNGEVSKTEAITMTRELGALAKKSGGFE
jgi:hypothetical protein